jgi:hypothetical protein
MATADTSISRGDCGSIDYSILLHEESDEA